MILFCRGGFGPVSPFCLPSLYGFLKFLYRHCRLSCQFFLASTSLSNHAVNSWSCNCIGFTIIYVKDPRITLGCRPDFSFSGSFDRWFRTREFREESLYLLLFASFVPDGWLKVTLFAYSFLCGDISHELCECSLNSCLFLYQPVFS